MDRYEEILQRLDTGVATIAEAVNGVRAVQQEHSHHLQNIDGHLGRLNGRVGRHDSLLDDLQGRMDKRDVSEAFQTGKKEAWSGLLRLVGKLPIGKATMWAVAALVGAEKLPQLVKYLLG